MKKKRPSLAATLPPAWQAENGMSIVDFALKEARKRGFDVHEIVVPMKIDPKARNQLMIQGHRCQVLPGRLLEPAEGYAKEAVRLHPPFSWPSEFLIYVVKGYPRPSQHGFYVLPANESMKSGAWSVRAKSLQPSKDAWHLLGKVAPEA